MKQNIIIHVHLYTSNIMNLIHPPNWNFQETEVIHNHTEELGTADSNWLIFNY